MDWRMFGKRIHFFLTILVIIFPTSSRCNDEGALDVAAFNVQSFGLKKISNDDIRENLVKIVLRYDLILIQEIKDVSGEAIQMLLNEVQKVDPRYRMKVSERLGTSSYKEQYAFIYRNDWLHVIGEFTFDDVDDIFMREPYVVRFKSNRASVQDFAVVAIHTSPRDAEEEISSLVDVYDDIVSRWGLKNVVIMGDFNAGCKYVKNWEDIKLATDRRFYWLIGNSADSTTKATDCPYDRIVISGVDLLKGVLPLSSGVFNFDEEYKLSYDVTVEISDHYPVEFKIKSLAEEKNIVHSTSINLFDKTTKKPTMSKLQKLLWKAKTNGYRFSTFYDQSGKPTKIKFLFKINGNVQKTLTDLMQIFPGYISKTQVFAATRKLIDTNMLRFLPRGHGLFQTLYDYYKNKTTKKYAQFECKMLENHSICELQIKTT